MDPWFRGPSGSQSAATSASWLFPKDGATFVSEAPYVTVLHGEVHLQSATEEVVKFLKAITRLPFHQVHEAIRGLVEDSSLHSSVCTISRLTNLNYIK